MTTRVRTVTDQQYANLLTDLESLREHFQQVLSRHGSLVRDEWLGGSQEDDHHEVAPEFLSAAFQDLRKSQDLLVQADSQIAIERLRHF